MNLAGRLVVALNAAGIAVSDVKIGDEAVRSTWAVIPASLQGAAQSIINTFNADDPVNVDAELDSQAKNFLDKDRLFSAIVWTIIDTYSAPATIPKYTAARAKIISAFKLQPWKP